MVRRSVMLSYSSEMLAEPVIYTLGQQFGIVINIRRADISEERGWVVLELNGEERAIQEGIAWVMSKGVRVDTLSEDS